MVSIQLVPNHLQGVWKRLEIRRKRWDWKSHTDTDVLYIQTPFAFIDMRKVKNEDDTERDMAFAGYTSINTTIDKTHDPSSPMEVHWHAIFDIDHRIEDHNIADRWIVDWEDILMKGTKKSTTDIGIFTRVVNEESTWIEEDLKNTLKEVWQRTSDGDGKFMSLLKRDTKDVLLVICGHNFALVDALTNHYSAGTVSVGEPKDTTSVSCSWIVTMAVAKVESPCFRSDAVDSEGRLVLPGSNIDDYEVLPGSTLKISEIPNISFSNRDISN